jgi:hypothetical protein
LVWDEEKDIAIFRQSESRTGHAASMPVCQPDDRVLLIGYGNRTGFATGGLPRCRLISQHRACRASVEKGSQARLQITVGEAEKQEGLSGGFSY